MKIQPQNHHGQDKNHCDGMCLRFDNSELSLAPPWEVGKQPMEPVYGELGEENNMDHDWVQLHFYPPSSFADRPIRGQAEHSMHISVGEVSPAPTVNRPKKAGWNIPYAHLGP